jgi:hypothetical protein
MVRLSIGRHLSKSLTELRHGLRLRPADMCRSRVLSQDGVETRERPVL